VVDVPEQQRARAQELRVGGAFRGENLGGSKYSSAGYATIADDPMIARVVCSSLGDPNLVALRHFLPV